MKVDYAEYKLSTHLWLFRRDQRNIKF